MVNVGNIVVRCSTQLVHSMYSGYSNIEMQKTKTSKCVNLLSEVKKVHTFIFIPECGNNRLQGAIIKPF